MSNLIPVPSLSSTGWVTSPSEKIDALLSHFFLSEKSQTYLYGSNVASLTWIIQEYGSDISEVTTQIRHALEKYLGRYYDAAVINVTNNDNTTNKGSSVNITLQCDVTENGVTYSVGKLLEFSNSKLSKIVALNNG